MPAGNTLLHKPLSKVLLVLNYKRPDEVYTFNEEIIKYNIRCAKITQSAKETRRGKEGEAKI